MFLNHFKVMMLKINFKKQNIYFHVFLNKKILKHNCYYNVKYHLLALKLISCVENKPEI
jgi:hypothetical protein